jgi:hypothetical protein
MTKNTDENKVIGEVNSPWELIAYLFKFRLKEILMVIIVILVGSMFMFSFGYDKRHGCSFKPVPLDVDVKAEVKK